VCAPPPPLDPGPRSARPTVRQSAVPPHSFLRPGYLRKNGARYSARTVVREYFDLVAVSGTPWFTVTTIIEDPEYLTRPYVTSSNFKKEADGSTWSPTACD
jgi:hypothetical protein